MAKSTNAAAFRTEPQSASLLVMWPLPSSNLIERGDAGGVGWVGPSEREPHYFGIHGYDSDVLFNRVILENTNAIIIFKS